MRVTSNWKATDSKRYLRWLGRSQRERRSVIFTGVCLLLIIIAWLMMPLGKNERGLNAIIVAAIVALLGLLNLLLSPSDRQVNQPFNLTPRARRLLVTAFVVVGVLPIWFVLDLALSYLNSTPLDFSIVALEVA